MNNTEVEPAEFHLKALLLCVNRSAPETPLYEAARFAWRISKRRAEQAEVILAYRQGIIIGAFIAEEWVEATTAHVHRLPIPLKLAQISRFYYNSSHPPLTQPKEHTCQIL
jgi:hypothetical protein